MLLVLSSIASFSRPLHIATTSHPVFKFSVADTAARILPLQKGRRPLQADSCSSDPSKEKAYFKRNRVCNLHSKAEQVHAPCSATLGHMHLDVHREVIVFWQTGPLVRSDDQRHNC